MPNCIVQADIQQVFSAVRRLKCRQGRLAVRLGVDFGRNRRPVAEHYPRDLDPEPPADLGCERMSEAMRRPSGNAGGLAAAFNRPAVRIGRIPIADGPAAGSPSRLVSIVDPAARPLAGRRREKERPRIPAEEFADDYLAPRPDFDDPVDVVMLGFV